MNNWVDYLRTTFPDFDSDLDLAVEQIIALNTEDVWIEYESTRLLKQISLNMNRVIWGRKLIADKRVIYFETLALFSGLFQRLVNTNYYYPGVLDLSPLQSIYKKLTGVDLLDNQTLQLELNYNVIDWS